MEICPKCGRRSGSDWDEERWYAVCDRCSVVILSTFFGGRKENGNKLLNAEPLWDNVHKENLDDTELE